MYAPNYLAIELLTSCSSGATFFLDHDYNRNPFVLQQDTLTPRSLISDISSDSTCFCTPMLNEGNHERLEHANGNPFCFPQRGSSEAAAAGISAILPTTTTTLKKGRSRQKKAKGSLHRRGFVGGGKRRPNFSPERSDYEVGIFPPTNTVLGCKKAAVDVVRRFSTPSEIQADAPSGSAPFCGHDTQRSGAITCKGACLPSGTPVKRKVNQDTIPSASDPAVEKARFHELDDTEVKRSRNDAFAFSRMMKQAVLLETANAPSAIGPAAVETAQCNELDDTDV